MCSVHTGVQSKPAGVCDVHVHTSLGLFLNSFRALRQSLFCGVSSLCGIQGRERWVGQGVLRTGIYMYRYMYIAVEGDGQVFTVSIPKVVVNIWIVNRIRHLNPHCLVAVLHVIRHGSKIMQAKFVCTHALRCSLQVDDTHERWYQYTEHHEKGETRSWDIHVGWGRPCPHKPLSPPLITTSARPQVSDHWLHTEWVRYSFTRVLNWILSQTTHHWPQRGGGRRSNVQERIVRLECTGHIKKTLQLSEKGMDGNTRLAKECSLQVQRLIKRTSVGWATEALEIVRGHTNKAWQTVGLLVVQLLSTSTGTGTHSHTYMCCITRSHANSKLRRNNATTKNLEAMCEMDHLTDLVMVIHVHVHGWDAKPPQGWRDYISIGGLTDGKKESCLPQHKPIPHFTQHIE